MYCWLRLTKPLFVLVVVTVTFVLELAAVFVNVVSGSDTDCVMDREVLLVVVGTAAGGPG
jgi:hypothetical protein